MASYNAVIAATAQLVHEAKLAVIDELVTFFDSKMEIEDDFKELITEFKGTLKTPEKPKRVKGEKKKREPSAYNLFVRDALNELKKEHPEMPSKDRMREALKQWHEHKGTTSSKTSDASSGDDSEPESPPKRANTSAVKTPIETEEMAFEDFLKAKVNETSVVKKATSPRAKKATAGKKA